MYNDKRNRRMPSGCGRWDQVISIAIIEDTKADAAVLREFLQRYASETGETVETEWFPSGLRFLNPYVAKFDLIFMDVEMPDLDGMTAAQKLRELDRQVKLIFVTNMAKYAIQGYSVGAMDYILKPVRYPDIKMRMERVRETLGYSEAAISIPYQGGLKKFRPQDIYYVESVSHSITFHTTTGDYPARRSMNEWERELSGLGFSRCNTSYIVNLKYVREVKGNSVLVGNTELQISRARKKDFLNALMHIV